MNRMVLLAAIAVVMVMPVRAMAAAEDYATSWAVSPDGTIGVAVHAYATGEEQKRFQVNVEGKPRKFYPVGVMIQNYGQEDVELIYHWLRRNEGAAADENIVMIPFHPYAVNRMGASKELGRDAARLNEQLKQARPGGSAMANERIASFFYLSNLKPKQSYYGVVYLESRQANREGKRPSSLDGIVLGIDVMKKGFDGGYRAILPLWAGAPGRFARESVLMEDFKGDIDKYYIGPPQQKPSNETIIHAVKALMECRNRAMAKVIGENKPGLYKDNARAEALYDGNGDMLSCEVKQQSKESSLNDLLQKLIEAVRHCDLPASSGVAGKGGGTPYYSIELDIGDNRYREEVSRGSDA